MTVPSKISSFRIQTRRPDKMQNVPVFMNPYALSTLFGAEHFRDKTIGVTGSQIRVGIIKAGIVIRACGETRHLVAAG